MSHFGRLHCDTMGQWWADIGVSGDMFVYETINGIQRDMGYGFVKD